MSQPEKLAPPDADILLRIAAALERAGVPPAVRGLVLKCTAKKPEDRYANFAEVAADIERLYAAESASRTQPAGSSPAWVTGPAAPPALTPAGVAVLALYT